MTESLSSLRCQLVEVPGMMYGLSGSCWIDSEIFESWLETSRMSNPIMSNLSMSKGDN